MGLLKSMKSLAKLKLVLAVAALVASGLACNIPVIESRTIQAAPTAIQWLTNTPAPPLDIETLALTPTPDPSLTGSASGQTSPDPNNPTPLPLIVTPPAGIVDTSPFLYYTQAGDTLDVVSVRFSVLAGEITSPDPIQETGLLNPGQLLIIPRRIYNTSPSQKLIPDSEVIFSPTALDFSVTEFVEGAGGDLASFREYLGSTGTTSGAEIVKRVALENSINPRLLLSLLEFRSGMVLGQQTTPDEFPMGVVEDRYKGLFRQLVLVVNQLSIGYYGWREGRLTSVAFQDGIQIRLAPDLNAGTAALYYYFAQELTSAEFARAIDPTSGWSALHEQMFGSMWLRAQQFEPIFPRQVSQPALILPFLRNQVWAFTGGPHGAWEREGSYAALDFAPAATESGCVKSEHWVLASAPGLVVRSGRGVIVIDLDGDGAEQTGWALVYLHLATENRISEGTWVTTGDFLGYPSCEGGYATGTHLHLARKYNGEWIAADGPLPFNLGGWIAEAGSRAYLGSLTRDDQVIEANELAPFSTRIIRSKEDP